jgi:hypothetical protein
MKDELLTMAEREVLLQPIISIANLSKTYASGFQALKNIDLDIRRGEIFALLGPNGAGKTTLINIICGIVNPTQGVVLADGHDIVSEYRAARSLIGLVPQELTTDAFETVWATVTFSRGLFGKRPNPGYIEPVSVGQEGQQDYDAFRWHEAPSYDRQGSIARAANTLSRRADSRRRCRVETGHVGDGALAARDRRDHHPDHPLHRRGRRYGRPDRGDQQRRDHPGRRQNRTHAQAWQETTDASAARQAHRNSERACRLPSGARGGWERVGLHVR